MFQLQLHRYEAKFEVYMQVGTLSYCTEYLSTRK